MERETLNVLIEESRTIKDAKEAAKLLAITNRTPEEQEAIDLDLVAHNLSLDNLTEDMFGQGWMNE
jgi:hypothetical protein